MRVFLVILLLSTVSAVWAAVPSDMALRYVNGEVITASQVWLRTGERIEDFKRRGKVTPLSKTEMIPFMQESLEQLTNDALMVQKAKELKFLPDHDRIVLEVLTRAKETNTDISLAAQAAARRILERQESIETLLNYYYDIRTPEATPASLWSAYQQRQQDFHRPARARVLQIIFRPSDPGLEKDLRRAKTELFKRAQDAPDATIAQAATSRLEAYLKEEVTRPEQDRLLDECVAEIAAADTRPDLDPKSRECVRVALEIGTQSAAIRDLEQTEKALRTVRDGLDGLAPDKLEEAFRAAAKRLTQGPNAADGGELGWVEPKYFTEDFDSHVFALAKGAMSDVFVSNQAACLVYVLEREDARVRSFEEVTGELEAGLRRLRREALRAKVAGLLRTKACISDVTPVTTVIE